MTRFAECLPLILAHEGGFSNRREDNGGPTNLGVTQRTLSDWLGHAASIEEVKALTPAAVGPIYDKNYWQAAGCHLLPPGLDYMVFDFAVNSGPGRARRYLQQAAGVTVDGQIGSQTLAAIGHIGGPAMVERMANAREMYYKGLDDFPTFGKGWLNRLAEVTTRAKAWASQ